MKPLLERKRRARINKCLDELKEIMTAALTSQGENVSKLEKADILELTVNHLNKMHQARRLMVSTNRNPLEEIHRFQAGYSSCAQEAASFLLATPGVDARVSQRLLSHLSINTMTPRAPFGVVHSPVPPSFPMTPSPGIAASGNLSNTIDCSKDEIKHHLGIAQLQQTMLSHSPLDGCLSSPSSTCQSRLSATSQSRRRSSGGTSSVSGSLLSPKAISSSSLPASSPTSSLTIDPPTRSSSFCDTRTLETFSSIEDKKRTKFASNIASSHICSLSSQEETKCCEMISTHSVAQIKNINNQNLGSCENNIKSENGCDKNVNFLNGKSSDIKSNDSGKHGEMKHVPIKPEPIRLPSVHHQQQQSITDPVWRPF